MKRNLLISLVALNFFVFSARVPGQIMTVFLSSDTNSGYLAETNILIGADSVVEWGNVSCNVSLGFPATPGGTNFGPSIDVHELTPLCACTGWDGGGIRMVAGPVLIKLRLQYTTPGFPGFCTLRITKQTSLFTPSTAVVSPSDAQGPVDILLESSTNLVDWVQALPGTYGTSSQLRYFRVRAVRK